MATIRKRGDKWHVQVRRQGHPPATKSFALKADADTWARKVEAKLDRGESFDPAPRSLAITLRQLLERYRNTIVPHKRSAKNEADALKVFLRESMCDLNASQVGPEHFTEYRDRRLLTVKPSTVCRTLAIVQHAYATAIREWRLSIKANPVKDVSRPRLNNQRVRRLSDDEAKAIQIGLQKTLNPFVAPAIALAIETGMRRSELLNLTWSNVDLVGHIAFLPLTKNGQSRAVPLSPKAIAVLRRVQRRDKEDRVLPLSVNALRLAWERLKRRAMVKDLRLHDLRHEAVSRFFEMGLAMPEVALISGHQDPRMLMRYTHVSAKAISDKLKAISNEQILASGDDLPPNICSISD